MNKFARLHHFHPNSNLRAGNFFIVNEPQAQVSCALEGTVWADFGGITQYETIPNPYIMIISRRVLDALMAEHLASFDAVRIHVERTYDLRKRCPAPEYYAVKLSKMGTTHHEAVSEDGETYSYWMPDFSTYRGHPFVEVRPGTSARQMLCIPRIAELAEKHNWIDCGISCLSGGGNYYEREGRRKGERTFREDWVRHREILTEEATVDSDLEAARRLPQGNLVMDLPPPEVLKARKRPGVETFVEVEGVGKFSHRFGAWNLDCALDAYFQKNVPTTFECKGEAGDLPPLLPANVLYLRDRFSELWSPFAAAVNAIITEKRIPVSANFELMGMLYKLTGSAVEDGADWSMLVTINHVPGAFTARYSGLVFRGLNYEP